MFYTLSLKSTFCLTTSIWSKLIQSVKLVEIEQPPVLAPLQQAVRWVKAGGRGLVEKLTQNEM